MDNLFLKYLKTLELDINANKNDIKSAYRKLVKIHHPDLFNNQENKEKAAKNFKIITTAYEYLISNYIPPDKRTYSGNIKDNDETLDLSDDINKLLRKFIKSEIPLKMFYYDNFYKKSISVFYIIPLEIQQKHIIAYSITEKKDKIFVLDQIYSIEVFNGNINDIKPENTSDTEEEYYNNYSDLSKNISDMIFSYFSIILISITFIFIIFSMIFRM